MQTCPLRSMPFLQDSSSTETDVEQALHSVSWSIRNFYHGVAELATESM